MSTDTDNQSTGTIEEAASAFEALLGPEEGQSEKPKRAVPEQNAEADEAEAVAETPEDDADVEADEAEDDGSEEEAEAQDEDAEPLEIPLDALVTVKIDGKEEQVALDEALKGYQRQADYQRKTAKLAEERKSFYSEVQQVRQERAQYAALLTNLDTQLKDVAPREPDWDRLRVENPMEFAVQREEWRMLQEKQGAVRAEQARLQAIRARDEQEAIRSHVQNEGQRLVAAIPEMADEKQRAVLQKQLREYAKSIGYSDEELAQAYDHRAIVALHKARQFDALKAKQQTAQKRPVVQASRPTSAPKPLGSGSTNTPPRRVTEVTRAKQRLAQTGSVRDAAALFEKMF